MIALGCSKAVGNTLLPLKGHVLWYEEVTMKPKNTNSLISLFCLWYEKNIHPLFLLSLHPVAPTTPVLVCAFFMFFIQRLCIRLVLEILVFAHIHLATEMWLARPVGGGGSLGGTNTQSAHAPWLVFFALITGTMLSDFHLTVGTLALPPLYPHSCSCCCTIWCGFVFIAYVPDPTDCV